MRKYILTYSFLLIAISAFTQSNVGVLSSTGELYQVWIDGKLVSTEPDSVFKIFNLKQGGHEMEVIVDSLSCTKPIYLENETEHWFEVWSDSANCKIKFYNTFPISQTDTITQGRTVLEYEKSEFLSIESAPSSNVGEVAAISNQEFLNPDGILDSAALDSISKLDFSDLYQGKKGCDKPEDNFEAMLTKILGEEFNSRKLKKAKLMMTNRCMSVEEIGKVLQLFEFEDHRLELIGVVKSSVFDLDNFNNLSTYFELNRSQDTFNSLINQNE